MSRITGSKTPSAKGTRSTAPIAKYRNQKSRVRHLATCALPLLDSLQDETPMETIGNIYFTYEVPRAEYE